MRKPLKKHTAKSAKQYHPDLHPDDPTCEDKFKDVQAAYSEVMRMRSGGGSSASGSGSSSYYGQRSSGSSQQQYQDPFGFGFGFDPFGFGGTYGGASSSYDRRESPEMQAANNYIRNGYYAEAMNVLEGIAPADRGRPAGIIMPRWQVPAWVTTSAPRTKPAPLWTWSPAITSTRTFWTGCRTPDGRTPLISRHTPSPAAASTA